MLFSLISVVSFSTYFVRTTDFGWCRGYERITGCLANIVDWCFGPLLLGTKTIWARRKHCVVVTPNQKQLQFPEFARWLYSSISQRIVHFQVKLLTPDLWIAETDLLPKVRESKFSTASSCSPLWMSELDNNSSEILAGRLTITPRVFVLIINHSSIVKLYFRLISLDVTFYLATYVGISMYNLKYWVIGVAQFLLDQTIIEKRHK